MRLQYQFSLHAYMAAFQDGEPLIAYCVGPAHATGVPRSKRLCQRCICMLFMMRGTICWSALPCIVCGIGIPYVPCLVQSC